MGRSGRSGGRPVLRHGGTAGVCHGTGPIAALPMDSADPASDAEFWSWLVGWVSAPGVAPETLRHGTSRGVLLEFCPEPAPHPVAKNRLHLDVRLESGDDCDHVLASLVERGGRELSAAWADLPWWVCADPSGNEFCLLPVRASAAQLVEPACQPLGQAPPVRTSAPRR